MREFILAAVISARAGIRHAGDAGSADGIAGGRANSAGATVRSLRLVFTVVIGFLAVEMIYKGFSGRL